MNFGTLIVLAVILGLVYLAIRSMKQGSTSCSCNGKCTHCQRAQNCSK
ncbi:MAG TPA: FeoB-associated Cys-rich membrane protein [Candidatus Fimiplasma intestinipullorum]|uniref:FeoB-associated Cys-rich membrane protein n=1 Tax=Candidatus Fimiplasma intestinipullorum TaxID=2840825 RepID=A0A9D1HN04_9FIRM|nr:FeoB-associated Cys-rich membrane protein [Candidatus Fimiplasma intestinipullorum]